MLKKKKIKEKSETRKEKLKKFFKEEDITTLEDHIFSSSLPVNPLPFIKKMYLLLKESSITDPKKLSSRDYFIYRKCLWFLDQQVYGQLSTIDLKEVWILMWREYKKE